MQVMVAMSGGVDSAVTAALMVEAGYEVVGVTMKLWGGPADKGCCSVSDVMDARRAADIVGIEHHVFNFGDQFDSDVIEHYVAEHHLGRTPNPCIECNRSIKFSYLFDRAQALGFDKIATGHHARLVRLDNGALRIARGHDGNKDQSYVLHMIDEQTLERVEFPVGEMTKDEVRARAKELGMRVANKADSQDVCFIASTTSRAEFLSKRVDLHPGRVLDVDGKQVGEVDSVEMVTIGQRKGLGLKGGGPARYVNNINISERTVTIGSRADLLTDGEDLVSMDWIGEPVTGPVLCQTSAHGKVRGAHIIGNRVIWDRPQQRVAPGQTIVAYQDDIVVGGGIVTHPQRGTHRAELN